MEAGLLSSLAIGLFAFAISHILIFKIIRNMRIVLSMMIGFFIGFVVLCGAHLFLLHALASYDPLTFLVSLAANWIAFASAFYCYFNYINIGEASLRIRVLAELNMHPEGLPFAQILKNYDNQAIIEARLSRLVSNGQLRLAAKKLFPGAKRRLIYIANFFEFLRYLILRKRAFK